MDCRICRILGEQDRYDACGQIEGWKEDQERDEAEEQTLVSAPLSGEAKKEEQDQTENPSMGQDETRCRQEEVGLDKRGSKRRLYRKQPYTCWPRNQQWTDTLESYSWKEARYGSYSWGGDRSQSSGQTWHGSSMSQEDWWQQREAQEWQCSCQENTPQGW